MMHLLILTLLLPGVWLTSLWLRPYQRSIYLVSVFYLLLSWLMVVLSFAAWIAVWDNQIPVRMYLSDEMISFPNWVATNYSLTDAFIQRFPWNDFVQGVVYALPILLVSIMVLLRLYRQGNHLFAYRYAALNIGYVWLLQMVPVYKFGVQQIISLYVILLGYLLLLFAHTVVHRITNLIPLEERSFAHSAG